MPGAPLNAYQQTGTEPAVSRDYVLHNDPFEVRRAIMDITDDLGDARDLTLFELVLAEVLNNIVEHAYAAAQDGEIRIHIRDLGDRVTVQTTDQGRQMPGLCLPDGNLPDLDVGTDELPEGGFGWFIFHSSTLDVSYERRQDENRLQFSMDLAA